MRDEIATTASAYDDVLGVVGSEQDGARLGHERSVPSMSNTRKKSHVGECARAAISPQDRAPRASNNHQTSVVHERMSHGSLARDAENSRARSFMCVARGERSEVFAHLAKQDILNL
jgi:hypothetical protein